MAHSIWGVVRHADFTCGEWTTNAMGLLQGYALEDVYNCDETGFFWRALPNKTLAQKGESCKGGKLAKERLTVLLTVSATGQKEQPLIIGKAKMPRAFGRRIPAGIVWRSNSKAWMNSTTFTQYLVDFNAKMESQRRHVVLILDNAPSHPNIPLSNVKLVFLPPNTTAGTQPLDSGVIRSLKAYYRRRMLEFLVGGLEEGLTGDGFVHNINVAQAVNWIKAAWADVKTSTIVNAFHSCGIRASSDEANTPVDDDVHEEATRLGQALGLGEVVLYEETEEHQEETEDWEMEILCAERTIENMDSESDDQDLPIPTRQEALNGWETFKKWQRQNGDVEADLLVEKLDEYVSKNVLSSAAQAKITDFFKVRSE